MEKCRKHHLFFIPLDNGHYKAVDTWCGVETLGKIWFCSEECKKNYENILMERHGNSWDSLGEFGNAVQIQKN